MTLPDSSSYANSETPEHMGPIIAGTLGIYFKCQRGFLSCARLKLRLFGIEISGLFETAYELRPVIDPFKEGVTDDRETD